MATVTDVYGKGNVGVIHFDTHDDASKYMMGHLINRGMHTMADVERRGWDAMMEGIITEAKEGPEYLFISFDIDVRASRCTRWVSPTNTPSAHCQRTMYKAVETGS